MKNNNDVLIKFFEHIVAVVIVGCIFWLLEPDMKISGYVFVPIFVLLLVVVLVQVEYIMNLKNRKMDLLISPKIFAIDKNNGLVLTQYSNLYFIGSSVSFYYNEGMFDIFIGEGVVEAFQDDENKLQIKITNIKANYVSKFQNSYKNSIKVKPFAMYAGGNSYFGEKDNG